jgi:MIP family channel proteins
MKQDQPPTLGRQCIAEILGTYLLVLLGPASVVLVSSSSALTPFEAQEIVAAVFGCTVAGVIIFLGRISGAHINPAVTFASAAAGSLRRNRLVPYILAQVAGAILAGLSLKVVFESASRTASLGSTKLSALTSPWEGFGFEVAGTFVLAMSALVAGAFISARHYQAILVGASLFVLITLIGPLTGASFNPARSLGPSLFSGYFDDQAIYYLGPVIGGVIAGMLFRSVATSREVGP